jgi:RNA polymerase sigma factor (sigma-70 family)
MYRMSSDESRQSGPPNMTRRPINLIDMFEHDQAQLFRIAYGMLGDAAAAEDIVQEVYLRVRRMNMRTVDAPHAYLCTIVRRLCLDALTAPRSVREQPLEPQLQSAALIESGDPPLQAALQREAISGALWIVLERLSPHERAIFLLREIFDYSYEEIAALINLSEANCRQLFHRAQLHLSAGHKRFKPAPADHAQVVEQFRAASERGELAVLAAQLVKDVNSSSSGWGPQRTARTHAKRRMQRAC